MNVTTNIDSFWQEFQEDCYISNALFCMYFTGYEDEFNF